MTLLLDINGRGFGTLSLSRSTPWSEEEIDSGRVLAGKVCDFIRQAQLNDIAQRDTFRNTFLVEINNLMSYSLGVGDALFMVVNILGKALRCSRCIFVCTDDKTAGWKCYEYWQQDKVKSCQECHWPTNDSALIAQTLTMQAPLKFYEGQANSYLTPAQAELQFSNTRSLLALPLLNENNVYGCVIIQQCDYRRDWTVTEVDTVQSVADRVAEALAKLPEEKRIHKPIMQLHQRIVAAAKSGDAATSSIAHSLKGAFGQQSIPSATETLTQLPAQDIVAFTAVTLRSTTEIARSKPEDTSPASDTATASKKKAGKKDTISTPGLTSDSASRSASKTESSEVAPSAPSIVSVQRKSKTKEQPVEKPSSEDISPTDTSSTDTSTSSKDADTAWGDLDAIPTPPPAPGVSGLGASMLPKAKVQQTLSTGSALSASLHKHKSGASSAADDLSAQSQPLESSENSVVTPKTKPTSKEKVETTEVLNETEAQAKEKVERVLSTKKDGQSTSEYIFGVPNVDPRTLGRINGWVLAIEQKDRYLTPHAITVAQYACAIAEAIKLPEKQIEEIKLAALVHDVGKLGISREILQKPDEELDDAELLTTMRHPIDGSDLLTASPNLAHLAPIVLAHHEEFGGNGYPQGLKGEEIPLASRIIYLANSYHSMTSDTRAGKGMSAKEAQAHLQSESGKQYDPDLVEVFLEYLKNAKN